MSFQFQVSKVNFWQHFRSFRVFWFPRARFIGFSRSFNWISPLVQQHQVVLFCKPYETECCMIIRYFRASLYPSLVFLSVQLVSAKNSNKIVPSIKRCTNYPPVCVVFVVQIFLSAILKNLLNQICKTFVKISFQFYWHHYCCSNRGAQWVKISIFVTWVVFESHHFFK